MTKRALVCGISGQDGAYLARLLIEKDYQVYGSSRDAQIASFRNLQRLSIRDQIETVSMSLNDFRSVLQVLMKIKPDEIYNLAGQSSVGLSFEQPVETLESIAIGTLNLLEAVRFMDRPIKIYNACSSECFGDTGAGAATESSPFRPRSPYAVAKATAFWELANYREAYGLYACSGILFNHESPLRPERFVTKKIISSVLRIASGISKEKLHLGNLSIQRDWGWAPEYVEAMWMMLQQERPEDFVIATGECHSLEEFVAMTFAAVGLSWRDHVVVDATLFRPTELMVVQGNPQKALEKLSWKAKYMLGDVIRLMIDAERNIESNNLIQKADSFQAQ
ncbi:MAG: GDP-mannose 4,6-dehydratase [Sulfuricaulis sp.]